MVMNSLKAKEYWSAPSEIWLALMGKQISFQLSFFETTSLALTILMTREFSAKFSVLAVFTRAIESFEQLRLGSQVLCKVELWYNDSLYCHLVYVSN